MEIVIQENTSTKSALAELERYVLNREKQWHPNKEAPEFARYEHELHDQVMKLE